MEAMAPGGDEMAALWRAESPLRPDILFLNPGTLGGTLRSASRRAEGARRRWLREGAGAALGLKGADGYQEMRRGSDGARHRLAAWLGVPAVQVALTGNATDGLHHALLSIDWRPGDRVITTDEEHEALANALVQLAEQRGVVVETVPFPREDDDPALTAAVLRHLGARTRMVAVSHVSCRSGVTADVGALAKALTGHGLWLLVDGAHGAGTRLPVVADGVDFYAFPGHKWLFGPVGTGALVVSGRALAGTRPFLRGAPSLDADGHELKGDGGAWRYEAGTRDWSAFVGLETAVAFRQRFDEAAIIDRYLVLARAFAAGLGAAQPRTGAGPVLSLPMPEEKAWAAGRRAWREHRLLVKPNPDGIRVTLGPWLTLEEATRAGEILRAALA